MKKRKKKKTTRLRSLGNSAKKGSPFPSTCAERGGPYARGCRADSEEKEERLLGLEDPSLWGGKNIAAATREKKAIFQGDDILKRREGTACSIVEKRRGIVRTARISIKAPAERGASDIQQLNQGEKKTTTRNEEEKKKVFLIFGWQVAARKRVAIPGP